MNDVRALTTAELQQGLDRDSGLHVLNVQTDKFFAGELIPGSRRVPLDAIGPGNPELAKDAEIVTYCGGSVLAEHRGGEETDRTGLHECPRLS